MTYWKSTALRYATLAFLTFILTACGSGQNNDTELSVESDGSGIRVRMLSTPTEFNDPFCVRLQVSATDMTTLQTDRTFPGGTSAFETVLPNIPAGIGRTVELGIFENGTCSDVGSADWYGLAEDVAIIDGNVTLVEMALVQGGRSQGIGSIIIRGNQVVLNTRLHGEVVQRDTTPIADATCEIFQDDQKIGEVVSGAGAGDIGVINTEVEVNPSTSELLLRCTRAGYKNVSASAIKMVAPTDPRLGTFVATIKMDPGVSASVVDVTTSSTEVRLAIPEIRLKTVPTAFGEFARIDNTNEPFVLTGGGIDNFSMPELPVFTTYIALPIGTDTADISVEPEGEPRQLNGRIYPIQKPMRDAAGPTPDDPYPADDESFQFDASLYAQGVSRAGQVVSLQPIGGDGDVNIYELKLNLVDYDPVAGSLRTYPSLLVKANYAGQCFKTLRVADNFNRDAVDNLLESEGLRLSAYVLNGALLEKYTCAGITPTFQGARFIIVTPPDLVDAANTLRAHKAARGISTRVVTTTTIKPTGAITAADIKAWLATAYNTWFIRPKWVLMLGDSELIPTYYDLQNAWDSAKNAGDIYYGQLAGGINSMPVFGIGRIPVDTLQQANDVVNKIIAFESSPPNPFSTFYSRETFAAQFQDDDLNGVAERWFAETSEHIRGYQAGQGIAVERIYSAPAASSPTTWRDGGAVPAYLLKPGFPWNGNSTNIVDAINAGTSLLYHRDHGWWWGWGTPGFSTGNFGAISVVGNRYPVVFSINCASGIFDNETVDAPGNVVGGGYGPNAGSVYWGEAFLRKTDGALAVVGDTRSSSTVLNNDLAKGLFDAAWPNYLSFGGGTPIKRLGDILNHAKAYVAAQGYGATSTRQQIVIYNLLGDPTLSLRTRSPIKVAIPNLERLGNLIRVSVRPEPLCPNCAYPAVGEILVVAQDAKGEVLDRGVVENGALELDLGNYTGEIRLTVSGEDVIPESRVLEPLLL